MIMAADYLQHYVYFWFHNPASVPGYELLDWNCRFQDPCNLASEEQGASMWGFPDKDSLPIFYAFLWYCYRIFHTSCLKSSHLFGIMALPGERLSTVLGHLNPMKATGRESLLKKNPDDIVKTPRSSGFRT